MATVANGDDVVSGCTPSDARHAGIGPLANFSTPARRFDAQLYLLRQRLPWHGRRFPKRVDYATIARRRKHLVPTIGNIARGRRTLVALRAIDASLPIFIVSIFCRRVLWHWRRARLQRNDERSSTAAASPPFDRRCMSAIISLPAKATFLPPYRDICRGSCIIDISDLSRALITSRCRVHQPRLMVDTPENK